MERIMRKKAPAQLNAWIDNGREAGAERATELGYSYINRAPSLPAGNNNLVVLRKAPAAT